ncbi:MAG: ATP-binding protein, partial [bacterium]|nr:ATP-binding protein [bacterium]
WEVFVRRMIDSENVSVVLSGSSAKLLGREIATSMRGRSLSSELLPFSFRESLLHAGIDVPSRWPPASRQKALFENRFDQYLEHGGFPEVPGPPRELRIRILQDYVDAVLFRDVAERHRVENLPALRYLQHALLSRPAGKFSIHRLHNDLKSLGVRVGKDSLYSYLKHLEDAFLLFTTEISSASLRVRQSNPRKCYPVDHGLAAAISFKASGDQGHLLENAVYLELRRRGWSACYVSTRSGFEVDFLAENRIGERQLIQVCAELSDPGTRRRELRALAEAMDELTIAAATVVTLRDEDTLDLEPGQVRIIPAWRWFLQGSER